MEHLDRYEREGIDMDFVDTARGEEGLAARLAADRELDRRDVREGRRRRLPGALAGMK